MSSHSFIRMTRSKPPVSRPNFLLLVRYSFRQNAYSVAPRDFGAIEHLLRRGRRQLDMYADPGVTDCAVSDAMRQWEKRYTSASFKRS